MSDSIDILKELSLLVRNATKNGENTAERVGRTFVGIVDILSEVTLDKLRKIFLQKDREDTTNFLLNLLGGIIAPFIQSQDFVSGPMGAGYTVKQNADKSTYAEFDKLLVRKKAVFQLLSIMETELAGASFLFNASGARITITKVELVKKRGIRFKDGKGVGFSDGKTGYASPSPRGAVYRCYFLADDGETAIENRFKPGNLARSQSFNIKEGVHEGVSNHYWWRLVENVGDNYIDVSVSHYDEDSDIPQVGDVVVQMGDIKDPDYQSAAILSAYGDSAPYLTFYQGINSYSLSGKDTFSIGYDRVRQECFVNIHGRIYIGDRGQKSYISFSPSEGLRIKAKEFIAETGENLFSKISAVEGQISLKVGKDELSSAGMTITNNQIKINADKLVIADSSGKNPVGVFKWENGKPLLRAENIDAANLTAQKLATTNGKTQLNADGSGKLADGRISWDTDGNISFKTKSSGERIEISSSNNTIQFLGSNGLSYLSMDFRDSNGSRTSRINMNDSRGRVTTILPGSMNMVFYDDGGAVADERGEYQVTLSTYFQMYHKTKDRLVVISPNKLQFNDGGTIYKGLTGTFEMDLGSGYRKRIYFKNGICYKLD